MVSLNCVQACSSSIVSKPGSLIPIVSKFQKSFSSSFSLFSPTTLITYCVSVSGSVSLIFAFPHIIGPNFERIKYL
ncbi:unnamed protein product [Meloidogyne enterolobii]|uniref:Uncharacterized protein n=1 Tax=Meloidogyne enterolobii TaxID=390850 RepID=A0ACB1B941_MELEN